MNNPIEIEERLRTEVKNIRVFIPEECDEHVKYSLLLPGDRMFFITVNKIDIEGLKDNVFVFSYFKERELQFAYYLEFDLIIKFINDVVTNDI